MGTIHELKNTIDVETPLGYAKAIAWIDYGSQTNTVWKVVLYEDGKVRNFYDDDIRVYPNKMDGGEIEPEPFKYTNQQFVQGLKNHFGPNKSDKKLFSRMDVIGQNGNEGTHYDNSETWMELEYYDEYQKCLTSGMFFEWFPELTGEWSKDKYAFCHEKRFGKHDKETK